MSLSKDVLEQTFIGRQLKDIVTPAVVLDKAIVETNCLQMLQACQALEVGFRPHVKTHKVTLQYAEGIRHLSCLSDCTLFSYLLGTSHKK